MNKLKPLAFIRKHLQIKGKSIHNGRGGYECKSDKSNTDMYNLAQLKFQDWVQQGLIEKVFVNNKERLGFVLSKNVFDGSYRYMEFQNIDTKWFCNQFYCGMVVDL